MYLTLLLAMHYYHIVFPMFPLWKVLLCESRHT